MHRITVYLLVALLPTLLAACAPYAPYRTASTLCEGPTTACTTSMLYRHREADQTAFDYSLGFVEFNDQGDLWPAASSQQQMAVVLGYLQRQSADHDLLMVVFVHGWHHSAKGQDGSGPPREDDRDDNVKTFQRVLEGVAQQELQQAAKLHRAPREVAGIYVGWRGDSLKLGPVNDITFWDRKNTAAQVGHGGVTELLSRLELIKRTRDNKARTTASAATRLGASVVPAQGCEALAASGQAIVSQTKLVVVGHSFGGLVVQSAVGQILEDRAVRTKGADDGCQLDVEGFGNLVVLINPAFEAQRYSVLHKLAGEREFPQQQLPVEVILTSVADGATGTWFPLGRHVSTVFDRDGWNPQNVTAVGHYGPYITHDLTADTPPPTRTLKQAWLADDATDKKLCVAGLTLQRNQFSSHNPYLNIRVSGDLIRNHNDIDEPRIIEFIKQMIMLSTVSDKDRQAVKAQAQVQGPRAVSQDSSDPACSVGVMRPDVPARTAAPGG